jgi:hypothetical protein
MFYGSISNFAVQVTDHPSCPPGGVSKRAASSIFGIARPIFKLQTKHWDLETMYRRKSCSTDGKKAHRISN